MAEQGMGRGRRLALLASSSCVALLIGGSASATPVCYTGPFPFTNHGAQSCISVSGTSFSGNVVNSGSGVISPGSSTGVGILVTNASTIAGQISNAGTISVSGTGIVVNSNSVITKGIVNSGTITAGTSGAGISVTGVSMFAGGIINKGTITAGTAGAGIGVIGVANFTGGILNTGTINAPVGIVVGQTCGCTTITSFSGGIANTGTISAAVVGIGVAGVSNFSGGISNGGTIAAVSGTAIQVIGVTNFQGGITNSGTIASGSRGGIAVAFFQTFGGGITNSGLITAAGSGAGIAVSGFGTFNGGILNTGTIAPGGAGIVVDGGASFGGGITNAGLITVSNSGVGISVQHVLLFTGGVTNSGTITGGATGIDICGCVVHFSGGITNSGSIVAGSNGIAVSATSFDGHIVNTGTISAPIAINLTAAGNAITIDQNAGLIAGNILFSPFGDTLNVRGGTINGNIVGQNAGDTINFALGAANTFTYGAAFGFSNVSFVNVNSGVVVLDGANQAGSIAVNGGVLQVGDAANTGATLTGSVDVIGGTLSGHGTVAGDVTIENGGVLFPGGSIGTLTIANGPLTFNPGSTYLVQILPGAGNNSATAVTGAPGNIAINGGTVLALPQLGHYSATSYTIATAAGAVNGTFTGAGFAAPFTYTGSESLSYGANDVILDLGAGFALLAPAGTNQNQQSIVNAINNSILSGTTPPSQFQNLTSLSGPGLLNGLSQLSGENNASFAQGALQAGNSFLTLLLNPYVDGRGGGFVPAVSFAAEDPPALPDAALAFAKFDKARPRDATLGSVPQFRVWGAAYGGSGTIDGDATLGSQKTTATAAAFAAGVDYLLSPTTTVGFALAGGGTSWGLSGGLGDGRSDMFQAGAYARQRFGDAYLAGALAYNFHDVTTNRTVTIAGTDMLQARFQTNGLGARIEGGYHFATPFARLTPYGAVQVQSIFVPAYGEAATAGSNQFALNFASQTATTTRTELGSWVDRSFVDRGHLWTLYGRLAWAHDFGDTPQASAIFQALPGSNFIVNGAVPAADSALITAGAKYDLLNGWSFAVKFDGEFSSNASIVSGTGVVRKTW